MKRDGKMRSLQMLCHMYWAQRQQRQLVRPGIINPKLKEIRNCAQIEAFKIMYKVSLKIINNSKTKVSLKNMQSFIQFILTLSTITPFEFLIIFIYLSAHVIWYISKIWVPLLCNQTFLWVENLAHLCTNPQGLASAMQKGKTQINTIIISIEIW
jgi:hypothetical protein